MPETSKNGKKDSAAMEKEREIPGTRSGQAGASAVEGEKRVLDPTAVETRTDDEKDDRKTVKKEPMKDWPRISIATGLVFFTALFLTQLIAIWPAVIAATSAQPAGERVTMLFGIWHPIFDPDVVLLIMVVLVGSLAALLAVSRRFLYFAQRDELTQRDAWSYVLRPFQGATLALIVYFVLRAGFLGQDESAPINPYGVAAISALVGLFTRHAVAKLTAVFDTVFGEPREDKELKVAPDASDPEPAAQDGKEERVPLTA